MRRALAEDRPDIVHVHSVYPMFSPSVLVACRKANVPVVMTVHSDILTCPTWHHLYKGRVCEDCVGGHEYRCVLKNCRNNILESSAYALRSSVARRFRLFHDNVNVLIVMTLFAKEKLQHAGFRGGPGCGGPESFAYKRNRDNPLRGEVCGIRRSHK